MMPGRATQFPASACDACAVRVQCTKAKLGQRTAVEHAISHQVAHQGRRARYKGLRKNQFDGRRHAAVSNLQVAARYAEERRLAS